MTGEISERDAAAAALAAEALGRFGRLRLRLTGTSMLPAVRPGDVAQFEASDGELLEPGDIALFRRHDRLFAHRVVAHTEKGVITQGDGLAAIDPPVANVDLLGKMVNLSRRGSDIPQRRSPSFRDHVGRWLFRHSDLATRLFLRWHALTTRQPA